MADETAPLLSLNRIKPIITPGLNSYINDEQLLFILRQLSVRDLLNSSRVCKRWQRLSQHRTLITRNSLAYLFLIKTAEFLEARRLFKQRQLHKQMEEEKKGAHHSVWEN